ncbi:hypothetical protein [Reyranella sp.]|uniref:hypothetical protein n=1 Tax=Reyranella sp. TaxID=1929291 RepID=UPI003BACFCDA
MSAADASTTADYWLLAAPIVGTVANVGAQLVLARLMTTGRLLILIAAAFGIGLGTTAALTLFALRLGDTTTPDALALSASILFIYSAAGFVLFAIINLGETSLRIRMMRMLLARPGGIGREELVAEYDDRALIAVRLRRLEENGQARVAQGMYYARPSVLFIAAAIIRLVKQVVYGRHRTR